MIEVLVALLLIAAVYLIAKVVLPEPIPLVIALFLFVVLILDPLHR